MTTMPTVEEALEAPKPQHKVWEDAAEDVRLTILKSCEETAIKRGKKITRVSKDKLLGVDTAHIAIHIVRIGVLERVLAEVQAKCAAFDEAIKKLIPQVNHDHDTPYNGKQIEATGGDCGVSCA